MGVGVVRGEFTGRGEERDTGETCPTPRPSFRSSFVQGPRTCAAHRLKDAVLALDRVPVHRRDGGLPETVVEHEHVRLTEVVEVVADVRWGRCRLRGGAGRGGGGGGGGRRSPAHEGESNAGDRGAPEGGEEQVAAVVG